MLLRITAHYYLAVEKKGSELVDTFLFEISSLRTGLIVNHLRAIKRYLFIYIIGLLNQPTN